MAKKLNLLVISLVVLISLIGCSSQGTEGDGKSGKLVIYSANGEEITDPILAKFNEKYPDIKVEVINAGTGELLARLKAEKENTAGDVLWGGEIVSYELNKDLFEAYESPTDKDMIVKDPDNKWHAFSNLPQAIFVNTDLVKNESDYPKTLKELADPNGKWLAEGQIALADPSKSGTGITIVKGIATLYDWDFVGEFLKNSKVLDGSTAMFNAVKDGELPVGFINEDLGAKWELLDLPVKMIYPEDGITNQIDALGIVAGAKNLENAQAFIDFMGSKEVHEIVRNEVLRRSARTDVEPPEGFVDLSNYNLIQADTISNEEIIEKFNELR
ncbi:extracellular solute-binding protein [Fredinandcohnia sp. 179-A 10B2 NHS]|uniref:extracellular solute-binding protein n=1 Tax=Fredinandcohnia sp. 179-A 10B2 NHS TaxID=3235176 RepID=UPI0039A25AD4